MAIRRNFFTDVDPTGKAAATFRMGGAGKIPDIFGGDEATAKADRYEYMNAKRGTRPHNNQFGSVLDGLEAASRGAEYDGKNFQVDWSGFGNGQSGASRPPTGGSGMPKGLYDSSERFSVQDDPRVQQALVTKALRALEPDEFSYALPGGEMRVASKADVESDQVFGRGLERAAQTSRANDELDERFAPKEAARALKLEQSFGVPMAQAKARAGDVTSEAEAGREFLPNRRAVSDREFQRRRTLATEPAEIAARGRQEVADITGQSRIDAATATAAGRAKTPAQLAAEAMANFARSGMFGRDQYGAALGPPPEIQQQGIDLLSQLFAGGSPAAQPGAQPGPGVPSGAAPAGGGGDTEGLIADVMAAGLARTREEAIAGLRQRGLIR